MRDPDDRLYKDSVMVRFEDGKLNPKATFTRLAAFLDLPYAESMTYCSDAAERDPESLAGNVRGFDPATVYRTYDEFANDSERKYIEFFLRDAYAFYGYDFHYYDGGTVDGATVGAWLSDFGTIDYYIRKTWRKVYEKIDVKTESPAKGAMEAAFREQLLEIRLEEYRKERLANAEIMLRGLRFVNKRKQPLRMTPMLQPDPALLEQPLYH